MDHEEHEGRPEQRQGPPRHVLCDAETHPAFGLPPDERDARTHVEWGVVMLDKPPGSTSRRAAERVQHLLGASKVGHGGTLDPKVTGVLPVLLGRATRVAGVFLGSDKSYTGEMVLHADVPDDELQEAVARFVGVIEQLPPVRSRVKRQLREREVYSFEVGPRNGRRAQFAVRCAGGTYIRKLIHDLGVALGCGAHMGPLRRTQAGAFALTDCATTEDVEEAARRAAEGDEGELRRVVRAVEDVLARVLPRVVVDDGAVHSVCSGYPLAVPGICAMDDFPAGARLAVLTLKGELIGVGRATMASGEVLTATRGLAVSVRPVLMFPDTYPRRGQ